MLRLIIMAVSILVFFIFSLLLFGIAWIIGKFSPGAADRIQLAVVKGFSRYLLFVAGVKLTVKGKEKVPEDEAVLYIINHRSYFDILLTYIGCPGPTGFIAKKELTRIPVLSLWVSRLHGLFLDRENVKEGLKTILTAIDEVKNGISIAIFPEGTRGTDPDERNIAPFHEGSFKISTKTGCLIVPVVICGSSAIFEDHMPSVRSTRVVLEYLDPIDPSALSGDAKKFPGKYVHDRMQEVMDRNHPLVAGRKALAE